MPFNQYHPYYYPILGGIGLLSIVIYWFVWKKNARLANFIVFGMLVVLACYLINWDYRLRDYFMISDWKLP